MKTKLQFIALASLAVMGAGCLAVTTGIITNEKEELSINAAQLEKVETSFWKPGNTVYYGIPHNSKWLNDASGAKFALHYWDNVGRKGWTGFLTKMDGFIVKNYEAWDVYYGIVPTVEGVTEWNGGMIAARFSPDADEPYNESPSLWTWGININYGSATNCDGLMAIMSTSGGWDYTDNHWITIDPEATAGFWAGESGWWGQYSICDQDGNTDYDQLKANWEASAVTFATLGNDVQGFFSNVVGVDKDIDNTATYAEQAAFQYDYIVRKYGFDDFAHRL